jgi:hypothetical protein
MSNLTAVNTPQIFLTDYASYNNGTQFEFGHWVNLTDFSDAEELMKYISDHFKESDEKSPLDKYGSTREETMIADFENFPRSLYSESMSESDFEAVYQYMENDFENFDLSDWIELHNEANPDEQIYGNDEDFYETFFRESLDSFARAMFYGDFRYMDTCVMFNGYGNLVTFNETDYEVFKHIDKDELINWKLNN